jgi:hypothetical protein
MKYTIYLEVCDGLYNGNSEHIEIYSNHNFDLGFLDLYSDEEEDYDEDEFRIIMIDEFDKINGIFIRFWSSSKHTFDYYVLTNFPEEWGKIEVGEQFGTARELDDELTKDDVRNWMKDIPTITYSEAVEKGLICSLDEY